MKDNTTLVYNKAVFGVVVNLAIVIFILLWTFDTKGPTSFSQENLIVRSVSSWVVAGSALVAALCNYLWFKNREYVWVLNSANLLFWFFCPAMITGDYWDMIRTGFWWFCLSAWVMMSTSNFLIFKRSDYSIGKIKVIFGVIANLLLVVLWVYLSYESYKSMKFQEANGWALKEDWRQAYDNIKLTLFLILPCAVSCVCNYFILRGKNLVWILNASNTIFWGAIIYNVSKSDLSSSMVFLAILVPIWLFMVSINYYLIAGTHD